jgi:hypothetical protein
MRFIGSLLVFVLRGTSLATPRITPNPKVRFARAWSRYFGQEFAEGAVTNLADEIAMVLPQLGKLAVFAAKAH